MLTAEITDDELNVFTIIERVASVCSLLGCIFIIATFCTLKSFHKPINRLVFYASMYGCHFLILISGDTMSHPHARR